MNKEDYLPIDLTIKDVQRILNVSDSTAKRRLLTLKDAMQLPKYRRVSVIAFCGYYDIPLDVCYKNLAV